MAGKSNKRLQIALTRFADTIVVKNDGEEVFVPTSKESNQALNWLLVSQARKMLQENLKKIRDMDQVITPREMKDIIESIDKLTKASHEVYSAGDTLDIKEKTATPSGEEDVVDLDFEVINHQQKTHERRDEPTGGTEEPAKAAG